MALVVVVPASAFLLFAGVQTASSFADGAQLAGYADRAALAGPVTAVVAALQTERDRTAGEMAGAVRDDAFDRALAGEQAAVDAANTRLATAARERSVGLRTVAERFAELGDSRAAARAGALPPEAVFDSYGAAIDALVALLPGPGAAPERALITPAIALQEITRATEAASRLRARLYAACRARFAEPSSAPEYVTAAAGQRAAVDRFRAAAPGLATGLDEPVALVDLRARILEQVRHRQVSVSADQWWTASTAQLAALGEAGARARSALAATAAAQADSGAGRTLGMAGLILAVLLVTVASWVVLGRSMVRSLSDLRGQALDVAKRRLPEALEQLRTVERQADLDNLPTTAFTQFGGATGDEIGDVGDAFAAVHASAVRLAGEQAELRRGAHAMIVNVARRSQALVERQLALLDEVQAGEDDPDQLANLFRLDHLLTRMRRNDENLLVLAGADTSRRRPDPVPLSAVALAAMAEIEEYERVLSDVDDGGYVVGAAVADVIHILAELLDNATSYSPPDTTVVVMGRVAADGQSATVRIADRGLGMSERKLAEANLRLGNAGGSAPDPSATSQMGLWVVGRLAARHGMTVHLRALNSGVQAELSIPEALLAPPPTRSYGELARSVLRTSMTHLLAREPVRSAEAAGAARPPTPARAAEPARADTARADTAPGDIGRRGIADLDTLPRGTLPRRQSGPPAAEFSYLAPAGSPLNAGDPPPPDQDPDLRNLNGWTRPIVLPAQGGRREAAEPGRDAGEAGRDAGEAPAWRDRPHPNEAAASRSRPGGPTVPEPADGGTSSVGLPVRVPMAQLPNNPLAAPPAMVAGPEGDEEDPAEVSAALNRFYRARHRAHDTLGR